MGIDPRTSHTSPNGILVIDRPTAWGEDDGEKCMFEIDFTLDIQGWSTDWFDMLDAPDNG